MNLEPKITKPVAEPPKIPTRPKTSSEKLRPTIPPLSPVVTHTNQFFI